MADGVYREFRPDAAVASSVECFWIQGPRSSPVRVLPDTCFDLIFSRDKGLEVVGTMTRPLGVDPAIEHVGVRFRAGGVRSVLDLPVIELTDCHVHAADVYGSRIGSLEEQLQNAGGAEHMLRILRSHIPPAATRSTVQRAIEYMVREPDGSSIEELAKLAGLSGRQWRRRCLEETGVTPKQLARISRFRRATSLIKSALASDWAAFAAELGYYDQSHLIHEFQEFAGYTPTAYLTHHAR